MKKFDKINNRLLLAISFIVGLLSQNLVNLNIINEPITSPVIQTNDLSVRVCFTPGESC